MPHLETTQPIEKGTVIAFTPHQLPTTTDTGKLLIAEPLHAERSQVNASVHIGRVLRLIGGLGVPAILFLHLTGELSISAIASAMMALAFLLMGLSGIPPLRGVRLRDAFRDDVYAFSPFVRELLQILFNVLIPFSWIVEAVHQQRSIRGSILMGALTFWCMALGSVPKLLQLRPRKTPNR